MEKNSKTKKFKLQRKKNQTQSSMSADEQLPPHEWLPWQEDAFKTAGINIDEVHEVDDEDDDSRKRITWIYSIEGDVGKSSFSSCLQEQCGALVVALGSKVADLKHATSLPGCETSL